ncbi:MAG: Gfo/Idh/MocA family oxidoreductase [Planctomycetes bacterium]|nr:Gfo/Idh/MocA family oxidoreductase [Planctomycetota bacterium]
MNDTQRSTRRSFIKTVAATGVTVAAGVSGCASGRSGGPRPEYRIPSLLSPRRDKLRIAFIGTGGIGGYHLDKTKDLGIDCPCFCDVDTAQMGKAAELYPQASRYQDYREMFDKEHRNIDAVMVGIPDHHHYPATILAMQLGKHVYTQKPLTHTPWEARQLAKAALKYKVATQMGNQGHALEGWRLVYEWIHSGALGDVTEVHTWTDRPIWPQGLGRPEGEDPVPEQLAWDIWLGPAPVRPFKKDVYHRFAWRGWWDFGAGALGDMACHTMDCMFASLDPGYPTAVEPIASTPITDEAFPNAAIIKWEFPSNGKRPAFAAYWYDGQLRPPRPAELEPQRNMPQSGNLFIGTKEKLLVSGDYGNSPRIIPETRMKQVGKPKELLERSPGHVEEWVMAAKGEKPIDYPKSNFAYAGPFTETVLLGNIALRVGHRLEWDGAKMAFTNTAANQYVSKEYRSGWRFDV